MPDQTASVIARLKSGLLALKDRLFPPMPDFAAYLAEQATAIRAFTVALRKFMDQPTAANRKAVTETQRAADQKRDLNMDRLNRAFTTPFDREDIFRSITAMDWVAVYLRRTINELTAMQLPPDKVMQDLMHIIENGASGFEKTFQALSVDAAEAHKTIETTLATNSHARNIYETALSVLFDGDLRDALKKREIYHHMTDCAKQVRDVGVIQGNILVKDAE